MTIAELIERLQDQDQEAEILIKSGSTASVIRGLLVEHTWRKLDDDGNDRLYADIILY